jgi:hypothetical protein
MIKCLSCSKETKNPKFCSKSCSATYTNSTHPRRKRIARLCVDCKQIVEGRRKRCELHAKSNVLNKTLEELRRGRTAHRFSTIVRSYSREIYRKSDKPKYCVKCKYSKGYEVAHIKSISSFENTATVGEVNDIENLIALCRNCHWEFDRGMFGPWEIQDIEIPLKLVKGPKDLVEFIYTDEEDPIMITVRPKNIITN